MPKKPAPHPPHIAEAIERNIGALLEIRRQLETRKTTQNRIADAMTGFSGNMLFVYFHMLWFALWILWNTGVLGLTPFDRFPFGLLTMVVSLEAIILSVFVLFSQNRQVARDRVRNEIEYQVNLKAEMEIAHMHEKVDDMYAALMARLERK